MFLSGSLISVFSRLLAKNGYTVGTEIMLWQIWILLLVSVAENVIKPMQEQNSNLHFQEMKER